jgi:hypothetical protein
MTTPMKVSKGWPYTPGNEMFTTGRIDMFKRGYSQHMNVPKESVIITPYGHQPLVQLPPGDSEGRGRLPASLNLEWARHPMFWLDPETRFRYPDEDEWTWAIRIDLELTARNLYNPFTGVCLDALKYFCEIDINNPIDRRRVENYRDGGYDQLLCEFWIPRDSRLSHAESRQMAKASSNALFESYKRNKELDRESAITRLDAEKLAVINAPMIFEKSYMEMDNIYQRTFELAATPSVDEFFNSKRQLGEQIQSMLKFLDDIHGFSISVNFVVLLHTESWKYQQESERLLTWSNERSQQRKILIEDSIGVLYQNIQDVSNYENIKNYFREWFNEIYQYGQQQVEQINVIAERGRLFEQYEMNKSEPTVERVDIGKNKWGMTGYSNPLKDF